MPTPFSSQRSLDGFGMDFANGSIWMHGVAFHELPLPSIPSSSIDSAPIFNASLGLAYSSSMTADRER